MSRFSAGVITTLLVVSVLAPGAIGGAAAQDDTVTVTLAVVDSDGDPVGDTDVSVTWDGGAGGPINVTTAGNGKAFVDVPRDADLEIDVHDDRYVRNKPYLELGAKEEEVRVPVSLSGQATVTVQNDNGPISDATVRLFDGASRVDSVSTGADGNATTRRLERGQYQLRVVKPGFYANESSLTLTEESQKQVTLERGTVSVDFRVVDDHFEEDRPIENATVQVSQLGFSSRTFEGGQTSTSAPVNREYTVEVSKPAYDSLTQQFVVEEEPASVELVVSRSDQLNVEPDNDRVVVGESTSITVTDEYGEPVSDAAVEVGGQSVSETDEEGRTEFTIDSAGSVTVSVSDAGLSSSVTIEGVETNSELTPGQTATGDEQTGDSEDDSAGDSGPGFGVAVTVAALVGALVLARR
ncbi:carboxypeptidase regulatory-like domain-containing protein [Salinibaculum rarum]|uniref:carboxypeptidase regulatory-like domain-containing protein n=1 Tax=Salinibaculum rarum TaxID=3058903 RepID=UPI00265D7E22|nr:carboxypeptidase regulatory-like domain-containing protein [Salinibaculum sp. KK48]